MENITEKIKNQSEELKNTISGYLLAHFDELENLHFPLSSGLDSLTDAVIINVDRNIKRFSYKVHSVLFPDKVLTSTIDLDKIQFFQIEDLIELIEYLENNKK